MPRVRRNGWSVGEAVVINPSLSCGKCERCLEGEVMQCDDYTFLGAENNGGNANTSRQMQINFCVCRRVLTLSLPLQDRWSIRWPGAMVTRKKLRKGEDILILGGSGGVAVAAIQISKMLGARVFVITSSDEKIEKARLAGADFATNRKTSNPFKEVSRRTTNRGVDLVVENVGALTRGQSQNIARKGGRLVTYGRTTGREAITNISTLFWNEQTLIGSTMGRIARHLKGSPQTVAYWVTDVAEAAPNAPLPNEVKEAEMDEMFTFLGDQKTKSIWLL